MPPLDTTVRNTKVTIIHFQIFRLFLVKMLPVGTNDFKKATTLAHFDREQSVFIKFPK